MASTRPSSEFTRIALIERLLSVNAPRSRAVEVGIGDDAAVLRCEGGLIWSIDAAVEGVHFERRWLTLQDVGYRAFQAALSDVAAMGARPLAALSNLALPPDFTSSELGRLAEGQALAARDSRCPIVGGNLTRASELSVTTSVLGQAESPLLRSGARVGDELWLAGEVGLAAAGLVALQSGRKPRGGSLGRCVERWRRPRALIQHGLRLARCASAALDVSDGLVGDAEHLAAASGVRVIVDADALAATLSDELLKAAALLQRDAVELALFGGEDYALLATGPTAKRPRGVRVIGRVARGRGVELKSTRGLQKRPVTGFDHFGERRGSRSERTRKRPPPR